MHMVNFEALVRKHIALREAQYSWIDAVYSMRVQFLVSFWSSPVQVKVKFRHCPVAWRLHYKIPEMKTQECKTLLTKLCTDSVRTNHSRLQKINQDFSRWQVVSELAVSTFEHNVVQWQAPWWRGSIAVHQYSMTKKWHCCPGAVAILF